MRRLLASLALLLAVLPAVAGCSDDGASDPRDADPRASAEGDGGSPSADVDPAAACDVVDEDRASAIVGLAVSRRDVDLPGGGVSCTYYGEDDQGYLTLVVIPDDGSLDSLTDLAGADARTQPLEIAGAEDALVVDDKAGKYVEITSVLARGADAVFTAYPTGLTREDELRMGTAALTLLLGGEPDPAAAVDRTRVPHPCDQLTQQEAEDALRRPVRAMRPDGAPGAAPSCDYVARAVTVTVADLGQDERVDAVASTAGGGAPVEVPAPAPLTAFSTPPVDTLGYVAAVATDRTVLGIAVDGVGPVEARRLARSVLPALVP